MAMRVSGINSGLDTDAIVQELVSAYSKKTEKYEKEQTKVGWKQEIWKGLNSKVYGLYTKLSNMRYSGAYAVKTVNSSDTTKATVSASGNAVNGTHKLNVLRTAQSAYLTGGKVEAGIGRELDKVHLKELGITEESSIRVRTKNEKGEWNKEYTDIKLNPDSTLEEVTTELQKAGLTASYDTNHGRFYISSKTSGTKSDFEIVAPTTVKVPKTDENGEFIKDKDGNVIMEEKDMPENDPRILASKKLLRALGLEESSAKTGQEIKATNDQTVISDKTIMGNLGYANSTGSSELYYTTADGRQDKITFDWDTRIEDIVKQFRDQGVDAGFDAETKKLVFYDDITFDPRGDANAEAGMKMLGLQTLDESDGGERNPIKMQGQDSVIVLDGVRYTSSTNEFSVNGLNITAQGVTDKLDTPDDPDFLNVKDKDLGSGVSISTNTDTQGLYDTIKNFLTEYNAIINEITKLYNADSAKGYEPLTDEERDAMSDTEIAKWETKIKDSLLRRDNSLGTIMNTMMRAMNTAVNVNGQSINLTTYRIHTMGFLNAVDNEQNAFHIDGDEEDENTAGNKDYLMAAIKEDPDTVVEFMKQLSTNLYNAIDKEMQGNSLRSKYKIYNDKELDKQYKNYTQTIKEWEKKVAAKEEYYYKKFSAMETALAKLNSQQSSLAGLLGN